MAPRLLLLVTLFTFASERLHAQGCCTVGASSLGGVESGILPYKTLSIGINYQYNSLTSAYQERSSIDDPLHRDATVGYLNLQVEYGLQPRLSVFGSINYSGKKRELTIAKGTGSGRVLETASFSASGIGDAVLLVKYQIVTPTIASPMEVGIGGGVSLPTGSFTKEENGAQLSIDLQPGTGAPALLGWGFVMRSLPSVGLSVYMLGTYRYAGANLDGYRIGDEAIISLGAEYNLTAQLGGTVLLRFRHAAQDFANSRILPATGGDYLDVMPGITYRGGPSSARVFGQVPLYRNVRGIQLTLTYLLGVEYRYVFDFRSVLDEIVPHL